LVQARLGIATLPEALGRLVTEKAEGNPLFAEEIVTFLIERGILQPAADKAMFDASALTTALPASLQGVLTARIDRLDPRDRALLQAASVIGRQFDPLLLASAVGDTGIHERLAIVQALDLIHLEDKSSNYVFKHALVRDALYQSLLTEARATLHAKIAEEIERRSGNRLAEVAEVLAHHYRKTTQVDKAFAYLLMSGSKSLGVYSLEEATTHLTAALAILDQNLDCASDDRVAEFLETYGRLFNLTRQLNVLIGVLQRHFGRIGNVDANPRAIRIRHHYVFALLFNGRYREAAALQRETLPIANRLGDSSSRAYALTNEILVSTIVEPKPLNEFEVLSREAIQTASQTGDAYIQSWTWFVIGWDEMHRGRTNRARDATRELMQLGQTLADPRATGFGLAIRTWVALVSDSYAEALEYSEQSLAVAVTPWDRNSAIGGKACSLVLLRQTDEGAKLLEEEHRRCVAEGDLYQLTGSDGIVGVCKVLRGDVAGGIRWLEEAIARRDSEGYRGAAGWYRMFLCEVFLQIMAGSEKPPFLSLLRNLPTILYVIVTSPSRIPALVEDALDNPQFDRAGALVGRAQMILGLLYKAKKKRGLAVQHLAEARRILSQFEQTPMLARVETALAELGQ